jgi:predicted dehydrogenase
VQLLTDSQPAIADRTEKDKVSVSFVGAGNYATAMLIPAFKAAGARLRCVVSAGGVSGLHAGRKYGFEETTTDADRLFADLATDAVAITTRHDSHARFVINALQAGKHVFVEKPLCLTLIELDKITDIVSNLQNPPTEFRHLMVGFNRRFAPQVLKIKQLIDGVNYPKSFIITVNAGAISPSHWVQDLEVGGGRIVGEACHFIDLLRFLAGKPIIHWQLMEMDAVTRDTVSFQLGFVDGSIGTVHYFANGSKVFPKERLEVFAAGRVLQLDNFRRLKGFGWPGFKKMNLLRQDKGQKACAAAFLAAVGKKGPPPIPLDEIIEVSRVAIHLASCNPKHTGLAKSDLD